MKMKMKMKMKGADDMESNPKMCYWKREFGSGVRILRGKIVKLKTNTTQHRTLDLLTDNLNGMRLKIKEYSLRDILTQPCLKDESLWLESCRTATTAIEAKQIIARGLKELPNSVDLWMKAAELETENVEKMRVLMTGVENIAASVWLWKELVASANEDDTKFWLSRAAECFPSCVEFWMVLACLQDSVDDAKMVIDKARKMLARDPAIKQARCLLEQTKNMTTAIAALRSKEILDTCRVTTIANPAFLPVARWEAIKLLIYNVKPYHTRRSAPCNNASLPTSQ